MKEESSRIENFLLNWERPADRLHRFLASHHHWFTLIGVFIALAGYIQTIGNSLGASQGLLRLSYFATFSLVALLVVFAYFRLSLFIVKSDFGPVSRENIGITGFGVTFAFIIGIIAQIISNLPKVWFTILAPSFLLLMILTSIYLIGTILNLAQSIADRTSYSYNRLGGGAIVCLDVVIILAANTNVIDPELAEAFEPGVPLLTLFHFFVSMTLSTTFILNSGLLILMILVLTKDRVVDPALHTISG